MKAACFVALGAMMAAGVGCSDSSATGGDVGVVVLADVGPIEADAKPDVVAQPDVAVEPDVVAAPDAGVKPDGGGAKPAVIPDCQKWTCTNGVGTCSLQPIEDGTPCDDGDNCTTASVCGGGACLAGSAEAWPDEPPALFPQTWAPAPPRYVGNPEGCGPCAGGRVFKTVREEPHETQSFDAVVEDGAGGFVVIQGRRLLTRLDGDLNPTWSREFSALPQWHHAPQSATLFRGADGKYVACSQGGADHFTDRTLATFDSDGAREWERAFVEGQADHVGDVLLHSDGTIYALGAHDTPKTTITWLGGHVSALNPAGQELWNVGLGEEITGGSWHRAMAWVTPESFLVTGARWEFKSPAEPELGVKFSPTLARVTTTGEVLWLRDDLNPEAFTEHFWVAAAVADRRVLFAGSEGLGFGDDGGDRYLALKVVDRDGDVVARQHFESPWQEGGRSFPRPLAAISAVDGGAILVGESREYLNVQTGPLVFENPFVMKVDAWANIEWIRYYGPGPGAYRNAFFGAVMSADGSMVLVGGFPVGTNTPGLEPERGLLVRTDFWGRTCGMRLGVCADKPWYECEDDNPCTANWCDPDLGCTHPVKPDGSVCAVGKTCLAGVCQ
ncbi:MAG: hypothetical protein R3F39_23985 [Myxococcota bacterium]